MESRFVAGASHPKVKWRLMVTSCFRRMGNNLKALELYEKIHGEYPENLECKWLFCMWKARWTAFAKGVLIRMSRAYPDDPFAVFTALTAS